MYYKMIIYINSFDFNKISFEDLNINKFYSENLFITQNGLYKKYKQHYYKINNETNHYKNVNIEHIKLLVQEKEDTIIKNKPLTYIPFNHYLINRKTYITMIDDNINFVKEIDNDIISSYYFVVNNNSNLQNIIEIIGLYLNNIINI